MAATKQRILVVDEDPAALETIQSTLEAKNYQIVHVETAATARSLLRADTDFELIMTETFGAAGAGFGFVKFLKSDRRLKRIPVVFCTEQKDARSVQRGIALGAADYILKPLSQDVLLAKVNRAVASGPGEILAVDDEELLLNLLQRILEREGHRVLTAGSGEEALQILESSNVSIVISDIKMSGMSGIDLLAKIKSSYHGLPVLLMTGHAGEYGKEEVLSAGADGYITKPFKNIEIIHRIGAVLQTSHNVSTARIRENALAT